MSLLGKDVPVKVMIGDLSRFKKFESRWMYNFHEGLLMNVNKVHIQGCIYKTAGFSNEILIINDVTGKVKVTRGSQVPGELSWIAVGEHCSVVGVLIDNGKLPHVAAIKIAKINTNILQKMWLLEVTELKNLITNRILPSLPKDEIS